MKKVMVTILSCLFFLVAQAQVAEFLSLRSATSQKDSTRSIVQVKAWLVQEMRIQLDLTRQKIQFFSKGMLDRDPFTAIKEIVIVSVTSSPDNNNEKIINDFSGFDNVGRKCNVTIKLTKDEYKIPDGEIRVEYADRTEVYKVRALKQVPTFN